MIKKSDKKLLFYILKDKRFQVGFAFIAICSIGFALALSLYCGLIWGLIGSIIFGVVITVFVQWYLGIVSGILACLTVGILSFLQWLF